MSIQTQNGFLFSGPITRALSLCSCKSDVVNVFHSCAGEFITDIAYTLSISHEVFPGNASYMLTNS